MAISHPVGTDKLNSPSHSLSHRVFSNDSGAPQDSVTVDSSGAVSFTGGIAVPSGSGTLAKKRLANRIQVGALGDYTTLKAAVDWFNSSATASTEILLDGGIHLIADTVTVNNSSYKLQIRGLGSAVTRLHAATGLTGKPMFNIKTNCDLNKLTATGSTLASYGTLANENFITFDTTASIYTEVKDFFIDTFKIGICDLIGVTLFVFDWVIDTCGIGIQTNYSTGSITTEKDIFVGHMVNCPIGIDLLKANTGNFTIEATVFQNPVNGIAVKYTGGAGNYVLGTITNILTCSYNNVGTFLSGFDFTIARDANIGVRSCLGVEDKSPHAKINLSAGATTTAITTGGVYYKAAFTNGTTYTCKMELTNGKMNCLTSRSYDGMMWLNGTMSVDQANRTLHFCIRKNLVITSVTGNGTTVTVTTTTPHKLQSGDSVQMLGWTGGTGTWNGIKTITVTGTNTFTYLNNGNGTATGGTSGVLLSPMAVRTATSGQPAAFSLCVYLDGMTLNDYYEPYVTSTNNGDNITMVDLTWMLDSR